MGRFCGGWVDVERKPGRGGGGREGEDDREGGRRREGAIGREGKRVTVWVRVREKEVEQIEKTEENRLPMYTAHITKHRSNLFKAFGSSANVLSNAGESPCSRLHTTLGAGGDHLLSSPPLQHWTYGLCSWRCGRDVITLCSTFMTGTRPSVSMEERGSGRIGMGT